MPKIAYVQERRILGCKAKDKESFFSQKRKVSGRFAGRMFCNDACVCVSFIEKMPVKERNNWYLMGGGVTCDSCPEVIHIEQILGNYQNYAYELA